MGIGEEITKDTDLGDLAVRHRFSHAEANADKTLITVSMTNERYAEYKDTLAAPVEETIDGVLTREFIEDIEKTPDYKTVRIIVDGAALAAEGISTEEDIN
jgi:hypothetical protein